MTDRENFLSIAKRTGYERMPVSFQMCPDLARRYDAYIREHPIEVPWDVDDMPGLTETFADPQVFLDRYYQGKTFKPGTGINHWGVAHEPGSEAACHGRHADHRLGAGLVYAGYGKSHVRHDDGR